MSAFGLDWFILPQQKDEECRSKKAQVKRRENDQKYISV